MSSRLQSIDVYRGLAIVAMAAYHLIWDLNYFGFISVGIGIDPVWISIQRGIVTAFLLLVGASLWLGHGAGIRWRGYWKREGFLIAAAIGVSITTWFQFGEYFAYFGILHAIALFSLMGLAFLGAPVWLTLLAALVVLVLPWAYSADVFNVRWLSWLGFFTDTPPTADLVPVFPWFGVVLLGMVGMRLMRDTVAFTWTSGEPLPRALAAMGRWSLVIYLVHQPVLFGLVSAIYAMQGG